MLEKADQESCSMQLQSTITRPKCGHWSVETMPIDACQCFYDCKGCGERLKPNAGDCCVSAHTDRCAVRRSKQEMVVRAIDTSVPSTQTVALDKGQEEKVVDRFKADRDDQFRNFSDAARALKKRSRRSSPSTSSHTQNLKKRTRISGSSKAGSIHHSRSRRMAARC
jgi:hypothetical protein